LTYSIREAPNNTIRTWRTRVAATVKAIALRRINYSVALTIPKKTKSKYSKSIQVIHQYRVEIPFQKERSTNKAGMAGE
jgi:hypothetical protein